MELLGEWIVPRVRGARGDAVIQLFAGDLAAIPAEHAVDALVVSAFPDSYTPNAGTLFDSLHRRGLDMRQVALRKEEDERPRLGCWLSRPLPAAISRTFHFRRIICFEPRHPAFVKRTGLDVERLEDAAGFVFRCLNNFVIPDTKGKRSFDISKLAMPILATGNQGVPLRAMFPRLLEAAVSWLEQGLPVDEVKIVAHGKRAERAARLFGAARARYQRSARTRPRTAARAAIETDWESQLARTLGREVIRACRERLDESLMAVARGHEKAVLKRVLDRASRRTPGWGEPTGDGGVGQAYDVFVSYAHEQEPEVQQLVRALAKRAPDLKVFFDRKVIGAGSLWIKSLSDGLQGARRFVAVLSPDYTASPVCWDEFQCAKLMEYTTRRSIIKTVRLYKERALPPIMGIHSYIDCAQGDLGKLRKSAATLLT